MHGWDVNVWAPAAAMPVGAALISAFLLGVVHGITPDEHTWPITFSYAIGGFSARRGLWSGVVFSLAFALQRALASELAYFALLSFLRHDPVWDLRLYVLVGLAMAVAGGYVLRLDRSLHLHLWPLRLELARHQREGHVERDPTRPSGFRRPTPGMAAVHGFLAGWGFGAFALILYTVIAPSMPNAYVAWVPGALFGLGTMSVQATAGALFGWLARRRDLPEEAAERVAHKVAGNTLLYGGIAFAVVGVLGLLAPELADIQITTGIPVHNLDHLGIGFFLVVVVVLGIGVGTMRRAWRQEVQRLR